MNAKIAATRQQALGFLAEFRDFAVKGNVIDLAVGVIIGGAFGKIVSSLVGDVIMPPLGALIGGVNFSHLALTIKEAQGDLPAVAIKYGAFLQATIDFTIVAAAVFVAVKGLNRMKRRAAAAPPPAPAVPPPPPEDVRLLTEIRDLLAQGRGGK